MYKSGTLSNKDSMCHTKLLRVNMNFWQFVSSFVFQLLRTPRIVHGTKKLHETERSSMGQKTLSEWMNPSWVRESK